MARKAMSRAVQIVQTSDFAFGAFRVPFQHTFFQTPLTYSFVNLKPIVPGHVLVSPKRVAPRLSDLSDVEYDDLWRTVRLVSRAIEGHYRASAINVSVQDGASAGQSVPHVHVHILPRLLGDYENNDDIYSDIEDFEYNPETLPRRPKLMVPPLRERKHRTFEEMAIEAAELSQLFNDLPPSSLKIAL